MIANSANLRMSAAAYLDWEAQQPLKYEYLEGEVYAMTGGTLPHNDIALNLYRALYPHVKARGCRLNVADVKVQVAETGIYFYPDIAVSCDERDKRALKLLQHPCLIIEVLSPSTEAYDRGEKFRRYRQLSTLQDYVLVDAETMGVECYHRNERGKWELTAYPSDDLTGESEGQSVVYFPSLDFSCTLAAIYEDVEQAQSALLELE